MINEETYEKREKRQSIHRGLNTGLSIGVLITGLIMVNPIVESINGLYEQVSGITQEKIVQSEIDKIAADEGYRACYYKDSLGLGTIGYGTLVMDTMKKGDCIDGHEAVKLLREHYNIATTSVDKRYPWAEDSERLVLINLSYNMGETRLAKFKKSLSYLKNDEYDLSAGELLNSRYAKQVPNRAGRLAGRIMSLKGE